MNRALLLLSIIALLTPACGGKTPPASEALTGQKVLSSIQDLEKAYSRRDLDGVLELFSPRFADRKGLSDTLQNVFSRYDSAVLSFQKTRMLVELPDKGDARITLNWEGEWGTAGGARLKDGGRVTLILEQPTFRITGFDGRPPLVPVQTRSPGKRTGSNR